MTKPIPSPNVRVWRRVVRCSVRPESAHILISSFGEAWGWDVAFVRAALALSLHLIVRGTQQPVPIPKETDNDSF